MSEHEHAMASIELTRRVHGADCNCGCCAIAQAYLTLTASRDALAEALRKVEAHYTDTEGASLPYELSCEIRAALTPPRAAEEAHDAR